jgi:hypothetical protein
MKAKKLLWKSHRFRRICKGFLRNLRARRWKVSAVNKGLSDAPETLNSDPYGAAWMIKIEGGSAGDVMDAPEYEKYCEGRTH